MAYELNLKENELVNLDFKKKTRGITNREGEVLILLASGKTNKEISENLTLSLSTVRNHISNIFTKLGITNRSQATAIAIYSGLLNLNSLAQTVTQSFNESSL